jgi:DNA polymerase-3 subunit gamma/tau
MAVLRDLAEVTHWVSVLKISPEAGDDPTVSPEERDRGKAAANDLPMRAMSRMWQMVLKALEEVAHAPNAMMAAEMAVIRMTHVAELPTPDELIRKLQNEPTPSAPPPNGGGGGGGIAPPMPGDTGEQGGQSAMSAPAPIGTIGQPTAVAGGQAMAAQSIPAAEHALARFATFQHVVDLIRARRDMKLLVEVENNLRLARYSPGRIEFQPTSDAANDLPSLLAGSLQRWTGMRWGVTVVSDGGAATLAEQNAAERDDLHARVAAHPLVAATLLAFPKSEIRDVRTLDELTSDDDMITELPELDDDWDPFEND